VYRHSIQVHEFDTLIKARGWKVESDNPNYVWIANHEESIKSRNIVEKIKFDRTYIIVNNRHRSNVLFVVGYFSDVAPVMNII
jgi:hypothetical protein